MYADDFTYQLTKFSGKMYDILPVSCLQLYTKTLECNFAEIIICCNPVKGASKLFVTNDALLKTQMFVLIVSTVFHYSICILK